MDERNPERFWLWWKAAAPLRDEIKGGTFICLPCVCAGVSPVLAAVPMGTKWVPFCVMALTGSWC